MQGKKARNAMVYNEFQKGLTDGRIIRDVRPNRSRKFDTSVKPDTTAIPVRVSLDEVYNGNKETRETPTSED